MLKDYVKFRDIDVSRIEQYKGRLPEELFDFWRQFVELCFKAKRQHLVISLHGKITSISGYSSIDIKIVI